MDVASLQEPLVRRVFETTNAGDIDAFMALFAPDAVVVDGPTYDGADAIRTWAQRETFGVQMHFEPLREDNAQGTIVAADAQSTGGYTGPATFTFTIANGKIQHWEID